ncbi:MAG: hypothetical protein ACRCT7_09180 [Shewanella sp.]|uniref:hypothetical protein n=1 Tax=Shewanella sp. SNU WT4 TaxID=2590015 RepID=UPI001127B3A7|nr:hypothetical protein [Shewanella sp. SNU WT4]QDF66537.1 hypothetical protein FJQ87_07330 [Shewanella sp. SNU WT4]
MSNFEAIILNETKQIIESKGETCPELQLHLAFLADLPMDSLDLATLIVSVELATGVDPFRDGFKSFHSLSDLIALYQGAAA